MAVVPYKRFHWHDTDLIAQGLALRFPDADRLALDHDDLVTLVLQLPGFVDRGPPKDSRLLDMILWRWTALKNPDDLNNPDDGL